MSDVLLYDVADGVATITMNRPDSLNALNAELSDSLNKALEQAAGDLAVRCVVLTGAGRAFSSGADLAEAQRSIDEGGGLSPSEILRGRYNPMITAVVTMEKPVVAAVNGVAAGAGASLAFACDFRVASEKARFIQAFVKIGLVGDAGANYFLPRLVGLAKAMELAMTGDTVDAHEALRLGLVNKVAPAASFQDEVAAYAKPLATGPTRAYAAVKKAMHFGAINHLTQTLDYEADLQDNLAATSDVLEGIASFIEKREVKFQGR